MKTEYGEVEEPVPEGTVGSSTMPQKRNPQLCQDIISVAAEIRALVPLALEAVQSEHEADHCPSIAFEAVRRSSILIAKHWSASISLLVDCVSIPNVCGPTLTCLVA